MNGNTDKCGECRFFQMAENKNPIFDGYCTNRKHTKSPHYRVISGASMCFDGKAPHKPCTCGGEAEFMTDWEASARNKQEDAYIVCERCGRRTKNYSMPWLAWEAWDTGKYNDAQINIFDLMEG